MKRTELFHPRVFTDQEWADGYYNRNVKNIQETGKRHAELLKKSGFKGGKILDAGCGFGSVAIEIAKVFPDTEIIGIDLSEPLLETGLKLTEKAGLAKQITLKVGDVQEMEFLDDTFDVVINTFMLHIVEHPVRMLNEIERVVKLDGKIIISDLRRSLLRIIVKKLGTAFNIDEAQNIIERSNLRSGEYGKGLYWWDYLVGL